MNKVLYSIFFACLNFSLPLMAALVVDVYELNGSTYFEASGSLDLSGVAYVEVEMSEAGPITSTSEEISSYSAANGTAIEPQQGALFMLGTDLDLPMTVHLYQTTTSHNNFGAGGEATASIYNSNDSAGFGLALGDDFFAGILLMPDFDHGSEFNQSMTFTGFTLEDLGIDLGRYSWEWSNGATATLNVQGIIPEPSTWATLLGATVLGLVLLRRRR